MGTGRRDCVPPALPATNLMLLATVHGDPAGYGRAWRFFNYWRPDMITVEISRFSVRYREREARAWRQRLSAALEALPREASKQVAVARVAAQVALPFEYQVARDWGQIHQVPVKLLDTGAAARQQLPRYRNELLTPDNLRRLSETRVSGTLATFVAQEFQRARLAQAGKLRRLPGVIDVEAGKRERLMARRLRRQVASQRKVIHLGGWEHLVPWPDGGGLFNFLADLEPFTMLLEEIEQLKFMEQREVAFSEVPHNFMA